MKLTEDNIKIRMIEYLASQGYKVMKKTYEKAGVDIVARHPKKCRYYFIECKGISRKNYTKSQAYVNMSSALGQIIYRMKQKHAHYAIAVPDTKMFKDEVKKVPKRIRKSLRLKYFFVDKKGNVSELKPYDDLK